MANNDKNYVSFWFWMFALFVVALPCIGIVMIVVWALIGENESRKNYFRALICWGLILTLFWVFVAALGFLPAVAVQLQNWLHQIK
jgi:hypothetical protein